MTPEPTTPQFQLGEYVNVRYSPSRGKIVELRGPLGPNGAQIYRLRIRRKPKPVYVEVREDQLIRIPKETEKKIDSGNDV